MQQKNDSLSCAEAYQPANSETPADSEKFDRCDHEYWT